MRLFAALIVFALLAGCGTLSSNPGAAQVPVQYATLKVIQQSEDVTKADVIEHVQRARSVLQSSESVSVDSLVSEVDLSGLAPEDRLLINALLSQIEYAASDVDVVGEERRVRIMTLLNWIEQAARYADQGS